MTVSVGVGVIGAGTMGAAHVATIATGVEGAHVAVVADLDPARATAAAAQAGGDATARDDPYALVEDPAVHAVVVASVDATHADFVLACLAAGKPVLCEKPLATSAAECLRVIEAEVALGRRLVQLGFMRRYDPPYTAVKRSLDSGRVGDVLLAHCAHRNASVPEGFTSEMAITSSVVHEIDATRWLLGHEIVSATVHTPRSTRLGDNGRRDPQLVLLETDGGVLVDVEVFVNARYGYDIRCELVGESGTLSLADHGGSPVTPDFRTRFARAYRHELAAFVRTAGGGGTASAPSAWDGYAANAVADACLQSLASGGRVDVALVPRPALYA